MENPNPERHSAAYSTSLALLGFAAVFLLSLLVLFGWFTNNHFLIQVHPGFAPMQFNTALCFLLSCLGGIAAIFGKILLSRIAAAFVGAVSLITLSEYILGLSFNLDILFFEGAVIDVKTSHLGRMSPTTCFSFVIVALGLAWVKKITLQLSCGIALIAIAVVSWVGYLNFTESLYGWGMLTRMAIHTSIGFFLLGISMTFMASRVFSKLQFWPMLPKIVMMVMVSLTLIFAYGVYELLERDNNSHFQKLVAQSEAAIVKRLRLYAIALRGGAGLINASKSVERHEWEKYVASLQIEQNLPGINGIGFIEPVAEEDLPDFLAETALDGAPGFTNHPPTSREMKFVIKFIEPLQPNLNALGLDIAFEENRREAARISRDTGKMALTEPIKLVQDERATAGFLLLVPVYKNNVPIETVEERRAAFIGWVYAPFIGRKLLADISDVADGQLNYAVYSGKEPKQGKLIYKSQNPAKAGVGLDQRNTQRSFIADERGLLWTINWTPSGAYLPPIRHGNFIVMAVLAIGLLLSFTLMWVVQLLYKLYGGAVEELRSAKLKAEEASLAKSYFLANMSHEIRTPMNGILGTVELMSATSLDKKQKQYVGVIKSSGKVLLEIINDILDLSKIESGQFNLSSSCINLRMLLESQVELLRPLAEQKDLKILLHWPDAEDVPEWIIGDEIRIKQVLANLIGNAIKFTNRGTITVKLAYDASRELLTIYVTDTGVGIAAEVQEAIFDPFMQVKGADVQNARGTGLGLAICKNLVEMMGGSIGVESHTGKGASFWFSLPYTKPTEEELRQIAQDAPVSGNDDRRMWNVSVLVAEDIATNQFVITELLVGMGCQVELANNGAEAVEKIQAAHYDFVLMDCQMPVMDGYQATGEIRKKGFRQIPIIALTANAITGDKEKCLAAGMNDYITKPVSKSDIIRVFERYHAASEQNNNALPQTNNSLASDMERTIESFGDSALPFLTLTLQDSNRLMQEMQHAIETNDSEALLHAAHALKSVMRQVMAHDVADLAAKIEQSVKEGNSQDCEQDVALCLSYFKKTEKQLRAIAGRLS